MRYKYLLALLILATSSALLAPAIVTAQWKQTGGPTGGYAISFVSLPVQGGGTDLLVATSAGVHRSSNNGSSWVSANEGLDGVGTSGFALIGSTLYAATANGVSATSDHGANWISVSNDLSGAVYRVHANGTTLFAFSRDFNVYRTEDGGTNWGVALPRIPGVIYGSFAIRGSSIFIGSYASASEGVQRSTDNGLTWNVVSTGLSSLSIRDLVATSASLIAFTDDGYFVTTNNGESWQALTTLSDPTAHGIAATKDGHLLAATSTGLVLSSDGGNSWSTFSNVKDVDRILTTETSIITTGKSGLSISTDNGVNWSPMNEGWIATGYGISLSVPDGAGKRLIAKGGVDGIFYSTNGGSEWNHSKAGLKGSAISDLTSTGSSAGSIKLFASTDSGVFISNDLGEHWTSTKLKANSFPISSEGSNVFTGIAASPEMPSVLARSSDDGTTWSATKWDDTTDYVTALATQGSRLHVGTWNNKPVALYSDDQGQSWKQGEGLPDNGWIYCFATSGSALYMGGYGVFISEDSGATWTDISMGSMSGEYVLSVAAISDGIGGTNVYAATTTGIYLLSADGFGWMDVSEGLADPYLNSVRISGSDLYVGTNSTGIWRRPLSELGLAAVGVEEASLPSLALTPNPAQDEIVMQTPYAVSDVEIVNMLGQRVISITAITNNTINVGSLSAGTYVALIHVNGVVIEKLLIKK